MKTKTNKASQSSAVLGVAKFKKQWEEFLKTVDGASLILIMSMQSEIEKKLKQLEANAKKIRYSQCVTRKNS